MTRKFFSALGAICLSTAVLSHTPLKTTSPESGSILSASPERVTLEFAEPVRLTQLRLESANAEERKLEFSPDSESAEYVAAAPNLAPGRNTLHWTALSPDGHVIEGTIILVVRTEE